MEKNAIETYGMLQTAFQPSRMNQASVFKWHKRFKERRESATIGPRWASRQFLTLPIVQTLLPVTFGYSLSSEAVIMRQLRRWKRLWRRSLTRSPKRTSMGHSKSCWNGTTSALQLKEITSKGNRVSWVCYQ